VGRGSIVTTSRQLQSEESGGEDRIQEVWYRVYQGEVL